MSVDAETNAALAEAAARPRDTGRRRRDRTAVLLARDQRHQDAGRDRVLSPDLVPFLASKAPHGRFDINPETRRRVLEAAAEPGYVANQSGRSRRQGATRTVGFMIESAQAAPTDSDNVFMAVFDGVQTVFRRRQPRPVVLP